MGLRFRLCERIFLLMGFLLVISLTGCAVPNVMTNVTVFHNLNGSETEKSYAIEAEEQQKNNLEFINYANLLNHRLQQLGYIQATSNPALKVKLNYSTAQTVSSTLYPTPFYGFYGRHGYCCGPTAQTIVDTLYMHKVEVVINRAKDSSNIYQVRSFLLSSNPELSLSMDYLLESAFAHYPGKNGVTETVAIPYRQ